MKEQIIINTNLSNGKLTVKTLQVFQEIQRRCVDGQPHYVDYGDIATKLQTSRNSVKYSVKTLRRYGVIKIENDKIEILKRLVL